MPARRRGRSRDLLPSEIEIGFEIEEIVGPGFHIFARGPLLFPPVCEQSISFAPTLFIQHALTTHSGA